MEVNYQEKLLLNLLNRDDIDDENINVILKFYIYLALLSLNNHNYCGDFFDNEHKIIDDFLRKVNNLKVKIQLKRKDEEINDLIKVLSEIYNNNKNIIDKYNLESIDFYEIIDSRDAKEITKFIDKLTLVRIEKLDSRCDDDECRKYIDENILSSNYYIKDNILYINDNYNLGIEKFFQVFDYLLDINNYKQVFLDNKINKLHLVLVNELIHLIDNDKILDKISNKELVPILLNIIFNKDIDNLNEIDTSMIKINNIKITDLYSFAKNSIDDDKSTKWNKITIPNDYLYSKLKELVKKGMYYIDDNNFTLENIDNKVSDFKVSIQLDEAINLINDILCKRLEQYSN